MAEPLYKPYIPNFPSHPQNPENKAPFGEGELFSATAPDLSIRFFEGARLRRMGKVGWRFQVVGTELRGVRQRLRFSFDG